MPFSRHFHFYSGILRHKEIVCNGFHYRLFSAFGWWVGVSGINLYLYFFCVSYVHHPSKPFKYMYVLSFAVSMNANPQGMFLVFPILDFNMQWGEEYVQKNICRVLHKHKKTCAFYLDLVEFKFHFPLLGICLIKGNIVLVLLYNFNTCRG